MLLDFHLKQVMQGTCVPLAKVWRGLKAASVQNFLSGRHQGLLLCRAVEKGWTGHPLNPFNALLRPSIGPSFYKAVCKTNTMIAPNHYNIKYMQQSF